MLKSDQNKDEFWQNLREKLDTTGTWPQLYMFKFIVPADNQKIAQVENLFNCKEAQINMRHSRTGKYVSISAKEIMTNADAIIERYKKASEIEGLMAL
jgi:putative lipoic acid-binding regulatory protein